MKANDYDLSRTQWEHLINEWIFRERDRCILKRRMLDGLTFEELAEEFYLSVQHCKTIVYKSQDLLCKHI